MITVYESCAARSSPRSPTSRAAKLGQYAFEVAREANKAQIKEAVETLFDVEVTGVNVMNVPAKRAGAARSRRLLVRTAATRRQSSRWPGPDDRRVRRGEVMAVKVYKPTSPGRRGMTGATFEEITKDRARALAA